MDQQDPAAAAATLAREALEHALRNLATTSTPTVVRTTTGGDALRLAARLADQFAGRVDLRVSDHQAGHLSFQVSYLTGDRSDAQDRSRWAGIQLIARELGREISTRPWPKGGVRVDVHTQADGVPVEFWAAIESPVVVAKIWTQSAVAVATTRTYTERCADMALGALADEAMQ